MSLALCTCFLASKTAPETAGSRRNPLRFNAPVLAGLFAIFLGLVYCYSRGAWLAMGGAMLALGLLRSWRIVLYLLIAVLLLSALPHNKLSRRFKSIWQMRDGNIAKREKVWSNSMKIIEAHPLLGVGPGEFRNASVMYDAAVLNAISGGGGKKLMRLHEHAHNLFLQIAAETGIAGIISFLWLMIRIIMLAAQRFKNGRGAGGSELITPIIAALAAFTVYSLVDCTWTGRFSGSSFMHLNLLTAMLIAILCTDTGRCRDGITSTDMEQ
jgi:putative inorganic carbon (HCO3(-)) transporter